MEGGGGGGEGYYFASPMEEGAGGGGFHPRLNHTHTTRERGRRLVRFSFMESIRKY